VGPKRNTIEVGRKGGGLLSGRGAVRQPKVKKGHKSSTNYLSGGAGEGDWDEVKGRNENGE